MIVVYHEPIEVNSVGVLAGINLIIHTLGSSWPSNMSTWGVGMSWNISIALRRPRQFAKPSNDPNVLVNECHPSTPFT